jgi:hypothetical protein
MTRGNGTLYRKISLNGYQKSKIPLVKFSEIANRLTGISTPLLGVSWQPNDLEVSAARRVIAFLEDRRVLYAPEEMEMAEHCVRSVLEIRHFLSDEIGKHDTGSGFAASLRAMRAGGWPRSPAQSSKPRGAPGLAFFETWGFSIGSPYLLSHPGVHD